MYRANGRSVARAMAQFAFCPAPQDSGQQPVAMLKPLSVFSMWQCGRPLCSASEQEIEVQVAQRLKYGRGSCSGVGNCSGGEDSEQIFIPAGIVTDNIIVRNLRDARSVAEELFAEIESQCTDEQHAYLATGAIPPEHKRNSWVTYTDKLSLQNFVEDAMEFVRQSADCRTRILSRSQLRFLILLQHLVAEDTNDFCRPRDARKYQDAFEGVLTDGVNSQLVKDAHRSEFSVEGQSFVLKDLPSEESGERQQVISRFQTDFVVCLETFLLAYCRRRRLSTVGTRQLIQAVTTQMSQAGLANLDRGSQATRYFVSSTGLEQRTAYNVSTMDGGELGEAVKVSILCMKTGFEQYLEKDEIDRVETVAPPASCMMGLTEPGFRKQKSSGANRPQACAPTSYLYQYATLMFAPGLRVNSSGERIMVFVLDALDEARIDPAVKRAPSCYGETIDERNAPYL